MCLNQAGIVLLLASGSMFTWFSLVCNGHGSCKMYTVECELCYIHSRLNKELEMTVIAVFKCCLGAMDNLGCVQHNYQLLINLGISGTQVQ